MEKSFKWRIRPFKYQGKELGQIQHNCLEEHLVFCKITMESYVYSGWYDVWQEDTPPGPTLKFLHCIRCQEKVPDYILIQYKLLYSDDLNHAILHNAKENPYSKRTWFGKLIGRICYS